MSIRADPRSAKLAVERSERGYRFAFVIEHFDDAQPFDKLFDIAVYPSDIFLLIAECARALFSDKSGEQHDERDRSDGDKRERGTQYDHHCEYA